MQFKDGKAIIRKLEELMGAASQRADDYTLLSEACSKASRGIAEHGGKLATTKDLDEWVEEFRDLGEAQYKEYFALKGALEQIAGNCGCTFAELLGEAHKED
jgi:hypothetical protein